MQLGRAAKSSFYVNDDQVRFDGKTLDELIAWGDPSQGQFDNLPISRTVYTQLRQRLTKQLSSGGDLYVTDAWSGRTAVRPLHASVTYKSPPDESCFVKR